MIPSSLDVSEPVPSSNKKWKQKKIPNLWVSKVSINSKEALINTLKSIQKGDCGEGRIMSSVSMYFQIDFL